jgi:hypothetical protein
MKLRMAIWPDVDKVQWCAQVEKECGPDNWTSITGTIHRDKYRQTCLAHVRQEHAHLSQLTTTDTEYLYA